MHLIKQSQVAFSWMESKMGWSFLNSFADIENNLLETEGYNNVSISFKGKHGIDKIESQIDLIEEDITAIRVTHLKASC